MAKFSGPIGFSASVETALGVWSEQITERTYTGNILRDVKTWDANSNVNDDLRLRARISIIADPFATDNVDSIKYVTWQGVKWRVSSVERQHPRLILTLGEVYNG